MKSDVDEYCVSTVFVLEWYGPKLSWPYAVRDDAVAGTGPGA